MGEEVKKKQAEEKQPPRTEQAQGDDSGPQHGLHLVDRDRMPEMGPPRSDHRTRRVIKGEFRILAVLCVVVGSLLLLENFGVLAGVHRLWPVFSTFAGAGLILLFFNRGKRDLIMMGVGSYMVGVSAVFFVCNFTSWDLLVHAWPVFVTLLGLSSILASRYARRTSMTMWISGTFLVAASVVLFLIFGISPLLWPVSLILFGLWILLLTWARKHRSASKRGPS